MNESTTIIGLDVHKEKIVAAVLPPGSQEVTAVLTLENRPDAIEKMVWPLAAKGKIEFVYEAGPCGYEVQRQISEMGFPCVVVAPSLTPVRPGDRVKTDRRDAEKLARLYRAGELTLIRIPSREEEAARDLVRAREDVLEDRLCVRNRLSKFLLRQGRIYRKTKSWGCAWWQWLRAQRFEGPALEQTFVALVRAVDEADARIQTLDRHLSDLALMEPYLRPIQSLRCLKGIDTLSALTLVVEAQEFRRFKGARDFMGYTGLVGSEASSGGRIRRGSITKTGNAHLRRILVEAAWNYRHRNVVSRALAERRQGASDEVLQIARRAQERLHRKYWRLISRNKPHQVVVVSMARELAGFVWAIAQHFPVREAA